MWHRAGPLSPGAGRIGAMGETHRRPTAQRLTVSEAFSCSSQTDWYWQQTEGRYRVGVWIWQSEGGAPTYRGYALEISKHPVGWHLGISPIQPGLPILANHTFTLPYPRKDDALFAARKRIDLLLTV